MKRVCAGLLAAGCLALLAACAPGSAPKPPPAPAPTRVPSPTPRVYMLDKIIERDAISAIDQPVTYDEAAADREYHNGEAVIGVSINGESRAYSTAYMEAHEIVNDVVGGQRIVVSWSPLSYSAAVYGREVEGRELTFGSSGELAMNTPVWYDRQTGSRWTQVTGEAIDGELQGKQLIAVPAQVTKWADWKARHPETTALEKGSRTLFSSYTPYYRSGDAGVTQRVQEDGRLKPQDLVLGVVAGDSARAYSYASLRKEPVINDDLDGQPALVVFDAANALGVAYSRRLDDGRVLSFKQSEGTALVDTETGSTWSGVDGRATAGKLEGTQLRPFKSTLMFWFAWKDWFPGAALRR